MYDGKFIGILELKEDSFHIVELYILLLQNSKTVS